MHWNEWCAPADHSALPPSRPSNPRPRGRAAARDAPSYDHAVSRGPPIAKSGAAAPAFELPDGLSYADAADALRREARTRLRSQMGTSKDCAPSRSAGAVDRSAVGALLPAHSRCLLPVRSDLFRRADGAVGAGARSRAVAVRALAYRVRAEVPPAQHRGPGARHTSKIHHSAERAQLTRAAVCGHR